MHYSRIALAATPVFFAYVSAYGSAIVKNSCGEDVYFWSCGEHPGDMITVKAGQSHTQGYYSKPDGGGPSLKIGVKYSEGPKKGQIPDIWDLPPPDMTQFEYTVGTAGPPAKAVFYDISNINGYPFVSGGVKMTSSDSSVNVVCPKGVKQCQAAYNQPFDDRATGSAPDHLDLTLELCSDAPGMIVSGGSGGTGEGSSGSGGKGGDSGGESSGGSTPQQPSSQPSPQPSSSAPVASSSPQPSHSKVQPQPQDNAPEKLAVNAPPPGPSSTSSAPTSSITPPPEDVVVWQTVTAEPVVVTVSHKEKRHEHIHQHVHNKINKKRHGN